MYAVPLLPRRRAFTLIELLVVMGIIIAIAALAVVFLPRMNDNAKVASAASRLQGWLLVAKQMAKRDQVPTGLRLIYTSTTSNQMAQFVYVQQPEVYNIGNYVSSTSSGGTITATFTSDTNFSADGISAGDYMQLNESPTPLVRRIAGVASANSLTFSAAVSTAFPAAAPPAPNYLIYRAPRPYPGEPPLTFPDTVWIDDTRSLLSAIPTQSVGGVKYREVIFSPSGSVLNGTFDLITLFVCDQADVVGGAAPTPPPTLISVRPRTGLIGAYPAAPGTTPDPIAAYAKDPRSSGL